MSMTDSHTPNPPTYSELATFQRKISELMDRLWARGEIHDKTDPPPSKRALRKIRDEASADASAIAELNPPPTYMATHLVELLRMMSDAELKAIDARIIGGECGSPMEEVIRRLVEAGDFAQLASPVAILFWERENSDPSDPCRWSGVSAWELFVAGMLECLAADSSDPTLADEQAIERATIRLHLSQSVCAPKCLATAHELFLSSLELQLAGLVALHNEEPRPARAALKKSAELVGKAEGILVRLKKKHGWYGAATAWWTVDG